MFWRRTWTVGLCFKPQWGKPACLQASGPSWGSRRCFQLSVWLTTGLPTSETSSKHLQASVSTFFFYAACLWLLSRVCMLAVISDVRCFFKLPPFCPGWFDVELEVLVQQLHRRGITALLLLLYVCSHGFKSFPCCSLFAESFWSVFVFSLFEFWSWPDWRSSLFQPLAGSSAFVWVLWIMFSLSPTLLKCSCFHLASVFVCLLCLRTNAVCVRVLQAAWRCFN